MPEPSPTDSRGGIDSSAEVTGAVPARVWTVVLAFAALGLGQMVLGSVAVAIAVSLDWLPADPLALHLSLAELMANPAGFAIGVTINGTLSVAIAASAAALSPRPWHRRLRLLPTPPPRPALLALAAVGFLAVSQTLGSLQALLLSEVDSSIAFIEQAVLDATPLQLVAILISAGLLAGIGEELFFRGYVQTRLVRRFGRWPGILIAAAAFGLLHFDWVHSPMAFGMGVFVGWVAERCGTIVPAIVAHTVNNCAWIFAVRALGVPSAEVETMLLAVAAGITGGVVTTIAYLTRRREPALDERIGV